MKYKFNNHVEIFENPTIEIIEDAILVSSEFVNKGAKHHIYLEGVTELNLEELLKDFEI